MSKLTTDAKIFIGIILTTIILIVGAVLLMGKSGGVAQTRPDPKILVRQDSWATGSANPKVTIVEYSDFQCPYCADAKPAVDEVLKSYPDVRLVYRHYPIISAHQFAMDASIAAESAGKQGAFWPYYDVLFANQPNANRPDSFTREKLIGYAKDLGLNVEKFVSDFDSDETRQRVLNDRADAEKIGISATPSFFINGEKFEGGYLQLGSAVKSILSTK